MQNYAIGISFPLLRTHNRQRKGMYVEKKKQTVTSNHRKLGLSSEYLFADRFCIDAYVRKGKTRTNEKLISMQGKGQSLFSPFFLSLPNGKETSFL